MLSKGYLICSLSQEKEERHGLQAKSCSNWEEATKIPRMEVQCDPPGRQLWNRHRKGPSLLEQFRNSQDRLLQDSKIHRLWEHLDIWRDDLDTFENMGSSYLYNKTRQASVIEETFLRKRKVIICNMAKLWKKCMYYFQVQSWF